MEHPVLLSALVLGSAGWLCGILLTKRQAGERGIAPAPAYAIAAAVVVTAVALVTVPGRGPGSTLAGPAATIWGRGFALGGLAALLAAYTALKASGGINALRRSAAIAAPCFLSLAAASAALLWLRAAAVEAILGLAAGWFLVSLILYIGLRSREEDHEPEGTRSRITLTTLVLGVGFTSTLCATVALGHFRDVAGPQTTRWTTAAIALAGGVPLTTLLIAALATLTGHERKSPATVLEPLWRLALAAGLLAGVAYLVSARILGEPRLAFAAAAGLVAAIVLWWLISEGEGGAADVAQAAGRSSIQGHGMLAALLALGAVVAGFYLLAGYGTGIVVLAGWMPAGVLLTMAAVEESAGEMHRAVSGAVRVGERLTHLLLFGAIVVLYRVFTQRFEDDLTGALLTDHFAIFSMLLGAAIPTLLASVLTRPVDGPVSPARGLVRLAFVLTAALALLAGVLILWGARGAIGLLAGLMLGTVIVPESLAALIALGIALPLVQWAHPLLQIAAQTRAEKVRLLLWLAGAVVAALLAADYGDRLIFRHRRNRRSAALSVQEGAEP